MTDDARKQQLLTRLDQIGESLAGRDGTLALLGLGSVGQALDRLDRYSDLDFFVIVEHGHKARYIDNLDWLSDIAPIGFSFQNTVDGHKTLFEDGIFCEFAVFEPSHLPEIAFETGRVVWHRDGFNTSLLAPSARVPSFREKDGEFLLGELLTNLYVGLGRYARGEKLAAFYFVQHYAVDRLLDLIELWEEPASDTRDSFSNERRFEQRYPQHAQLIASVTPGYAETPSAAESLLSFLASRTELPASLVTEIRKLVTVAS